MIEDPVTYEHMKHPHIDQHGHTFDLETISGLVAKHLALHPNEERKGFICPLAREWVNLDDLYPNLMVQDITEKVGQLEERHKQFLKLQEKEFHKATAKIIEEVSGKYKSIVASLQEENQLIKASIEQHKAEIVTLQNRCTLLSEENIQLKESIDKYMSEIKEKNNTINLQSEKIQRKKKAIEEQKKTMKEKDNAIKEQDNAIKEQDNAIKEQAKEIEEHKRVMGEKINALKKYENMMLEKDNKINELEGQKLYSFLYGFSITIAAAAGGFAIMAKK